jgi:hypothetical protein
MIIKIKELGKDLQEGETIRTTCPYCEAKHENSFAITRKPGVLLYYCHRATCGKHGLVGSLAEIGSGNMSSAARKSKIRRYDGELGATPELWRRTFTERYGISFEELDRQGIRYSPSMQRIYFPIFDYRGFQIGENLRSTHAFQVPKTLIYPWSETTPLIHFPVPFQVSEHLALTEDQVSSIKVAKVAAVAALLGTNLGVEGLKLLRDIGVKKITLMMDGDNAGRVATSKLLNKLSPFFEVVALYLPEGKDPKHLTIEQLKELLGA